MDTPEPPFQSVSIRFPAVALAHINHWAAQASLTFTKFCAVALTLGARIQVISLEPVGSLARGLRKQAAQAANASITPEMLLRLVAADRAERDAASPGELDSQVTVDLPTSLSTQLDRVAETTGIEATKLYALALATGVQLLASSLAPDSSVPLEVLVQMTEGEVSPAFLIQAMMEYQAQVESRKKQ